MERKQYPQRRERQEAEPVSIEWERLIEEALTLPGSIGNTYNRFYEYSFTNQILLVMQGVREPVATYNRWAEMGRQVKKGSKAKSILRPVMYKDQDDKGEDVTRVKGFKFVRCLFTASETEGDDLPEVQPREWSPTKALETLGITEVPFELLSGNVAGYSHERQFAVSPVAPYKLKTTFHELAHIDLGHTAPDEQAEYAQHRGLKEFQAEASAYLIMNELEMAHAMDASESRAYIQGWLKDQKPDAQAIKQVFVTVDHILKAGR